MSLHVGSKSQEARATFEKLSADCNNLAFDGLTVRFKTAFLSFEFLDLVFQDLIMIEFGPLKHFFGLALTKVEKSSLWLCLGLPSQLAPIKFENSVQGSN